MTPRSRHLVEREVRADDPELSPRANDLLTDELRRAIGRDRVRVPADQAERAGVVPGAPRSPLVASLGSNRLLLAITFVALLIVGVIVALATHSWWAVVAAAGVHALGTILVTALALRLSTEVEHVAPTTAARLQAEGVGDPDHALTALVEQHAASGEAHGTAEVVSSGHNRVTASPDDEPGRSALEQQSAQTPAGSPVAPAGWHGAPALLPVLAVLASVVIGVVAAAIVGGVAWLGAAMLVAASLAWLLLMGHMDGDEADGSERRPQDTRTGVRTRLLPTVAVVVVAVVAGVILVGAIGGYL